GETLRLHESDELLDDRIEALSGEVRLWRAVSSAAVGWPLTVKVSSTGRHQANDAILAMAALAGSRQGYVQFAPANPEPTTVGLTAEILADRIIVHGGRSSITLHGAIDDMTLDAVAADGVLALGVVFGMMEHLDAAAALITASAPHAPSFEGDILARAVGALARGRRVGDALSVGRGLLVQGRRNAAALVVSLVAMATSALMSDEELSAVIAFNEEMANLAERQGTSEEAAARWYSLGNWLVNVVHDWERGLPALERALALDSSYATRDYFTHERAAALFECRRYPEAVSAYEGLLSCGSGDQRTLARLGDAQLMAGHYARAAATFEGYLSDPVPSEPVWKLKAAFARFLVDLEYT
ncbi:MAG: hypothetical protein LC808_21800, partial [Actinobacteria bacterium]|nr:hypothetical protein [Actinomycetota bacterium]